MMDLRRLARRRMGGEDVPRGEPATYRAPTGSVLLTKALGGGYVRGAVTGVYGHPMSGMTFLSLLAIRSSQGRGATPLYVSTTGELDTMRAEKLGIDLDRLIVHHSRSIEDTRDMLSSLPTVDLIVIDSLDGFSTEGSGGLLSWQKRMDLMDRLRRDMRMPYTALVITHHVSMKYVEGYPRYAREDHRALVMGGRSSRSGRLGVKGLLPRTLSVEFNLNLPMERSGEDLDLFKDLVESLPRKELEVHQKRALAEDGELLRAVRHNQEMRWSLVG